MPAAPVAPALPAPALAQRFVGRESELTALDALLARAQGGTGGCAALSGEPGIGKTRTAEVATECALARGMGVLWGRCNEDPGAPPYWPWQQLLCAWLAEQDEASARAAAERFAQTLAEISPELLELLPAPPVAAADAVPLGEAARARFRLFDAMARFWKRAAAQRPLLLVIDNLHWADASSLRLLEFLAPELAGMRVVVLMTYRDIELSRQHPLSATLGELSRQRGFERLRLGGLGRAETARMAQLAGGTGFTPALVDVIHAQAEGNPLFIAEFTRLLALERSSAAGSGLRIPEGIKDVIGRRLNRLSAAANAVLAAAAVVGRAFDLRLVVPLLDEGDDEACSSAIEEALQARIVEPLREPRRYQFTNALFRETLYDEIPAPRRSRLHLTLVQALELIHADELDAHLPTLAHHQWAGLPGGDATRAVDYARRAAAQAELQLAHEEAARYCEMALQALDVASGAPRGMRCNLLNALGNARSRAGDWLQALETFRDAARHSIENSDARELAHAALGFEAASWCPGLPGRPAAELLRQALAAQDLGDAVLTARLLSALARALIFSGEEDQALQVHQQAVQAARRAGDPVTLADTLIAALSMRWQPERLAERIAAAEEAMRLARQAGDRSLMVMALSWRLFDDFELGELARWRSGMDAYERAHEELRQPFHRYVSTSSRAMHALFEGRFAEAEVLAGQACETGARMPGLDAAGVYGMQMFTLRREQGRLAEVALLVEHFVGHAEAKGTGVWQPGLALIYTELGRLDAARKLLDVLARDSFAAIARDGVAVASLCYLSSVSHALGDAERAAALYRLLAPYRGLNLMAGTTIASFGAADGVLGMLAATMGDGPLAERHFEAALAMNERQGARPALARVRLHFAQMLARRGEQSDAERAHTLLDAAANDVGQLGMAGVAAAVAAERATLALALAETTERVPQRLPAGLSAREVQVLQLVALGRSNREIAQALFVSPNTVANHVSNILGKTGSANRTEAAAFANRHLPVSGGAPSDC